jgi:integration host factor subunit alpha
MRKIDIVNAVYNRHGGLLRSEVSQILDLLIKILHERLSQGEEIKISNFGVFRLKKRKGRKVKNPRTGKITTIAPHNSLVFKPSKHLIETLNS